VSSGTLNLTQSNLQLCELCRSSGVTVRLLMRSAANITSIIRFATTKED